MENKFKCGHCHKMIIDAENIGTRHRNHCPGCLWSLHVDDVVSGDRKSKCHGLMEPIGLTFKREGVDKYGKTRQGELMIVHKCSACDKISINRIAGDDDPKEIEDLFNKSCSNQKLKEKLKTDNIELLSENDRDEVLAQLYGRAKFS